MVTRVKPAGVSPGFERGDLWGPGGVGIGVRVYRPHERDWPAPTGAEVGAKVRGSPYLGLPPTDKGPPVCALSLHPTHLSSSKESP